MLVTQSTTDLVLQVIIMDLGSWEESHEAIISECITTGLFSPTILCILVTFALILMKLDAVPPCSTIDSESETGGILKWCKIRLDFENVSVIRQYEF